MNSDSSSAGQSQRILNAIEPGTMLPSHRHQTTSKMVVFICGHFKEDFYDASGRLMDTINLNPGLIVIIQVGYGMARRVLKRAYVAKMHE